MRKLSKDVIIINELGLHARAAAEIAKIARNARSNIWIIKEGIRADASGIIDILTLACPKGSKIMIKIEDQADIDILNAIVNLVEKGFEE